MTFRYDDKPTRLTLYHYTTRRLARKITNRGFLKPNPVWTAVTGYPLVWLTDMADPDVEGLGLTRHYIKEDRTAVRYIVQRYENIVPWILFPATISHADRRTLEKDRLPERWFVSTKHVYVIRDREWDKLRADAAAVDRTRVESPPERRAAVIAPE